jgi:Ca2+-transporting ATPase
MRKVVVYLLSTSTGTATLVGGGVIAGTMMPILPAQILWANIVGGGLMSFAFAFEPAEDDVMSRAPRQHMENTFLTGDFGKMLIFTGVSTGLMLLSLYTLLLHISTPPDVLRTMMFVAISMDSIFLVFSFKNLNKPIWRLLSSRYIVGNMYLLIAVAISIGVLVSVFSLPALSALLSVVSLSVGNVSALLLLGLINIAIIEVAKYIFIYKSR